MQPAAATSRVKNLKSVYTNKLKKRTQVHHCCWWKFTRSNEGEIFMLFFTQFWSASFCRAIMTWWWAEMDFLLWRWTEFSELRCMCRLNHGKMITKKQSNNNKRRWCGCINWNLWTVHGIFFTQNKPIRFWFTFSSGSCSLEDWMSFRFRKLFIDLHCIERLRSEMN